jgi:hypothetical protein
VQVRRDEGVAIRIDPEPCAAVRKGDGSVKIFSQCAGETGKE